MNQYDSRRDEHLIELYELLDYGTDQKFMQSNMKKAKIMIVHAGKRYEHPIATAIAALHLAFAYKISKEEEHYYHFLRFADRMLAMQENLRGIEGCYAYPVHMLPYKLRPPWISAMAQGMAVKVFDIAYDLTENHKYVVAGEKSFEPFKHKVEDGGVVSEDEYGLWLEEYPSVPYSHVLNGMIFALEGVITYHKRFNDIYAKQLIDSSIKTLERNIHRYDMGFWSRYDLLRFSNVASLFYQALHVKQLKWLYIETKNDVFNQFGKKFKAQSENVFYRFITQMIVRNLRRGLTVMICPKRILVESYNFYLQRKSEGSHDI